MVEVLYSEAEISQHILKGYWFIVLQPFVGFGDRRLFRLTDLLVFDWFWQHRWNDGIADRSCSCVIWSTKS